MERARLNEDKGRVDAQLPCGFARSITHLHILVVFQLAWQIFDAEAAAQIQPLHDIAQLFFYLVPSGPAYLWRPQLEWLNVKDL